MSLIKIKGNQLVYKLSDDDTIDITIKQVVAIKNQQMISFAELQQIEKYSFSNNFPKKFDVQYITPAHIYIRALSNSAPQEE